MSNPTITNGEGIKSDGIAVGMLFGKKGSAKLTTKTVTENGTYRAQDEPVGQGEKKYDGYSQFTANIRTYEEEYEQALEDLEEALEKLDEMEDGFEEKVEHLKQLTGVTAKNFEELDQLIDEVAQNPPPEPGEETETPSEEDQGKTDEEDPTTQAELDVIADGINDDNGEPSVTDTPQDVGGDPDCVLSYFAIKGLGWYSLRIDKSNKFWIRDSSYYARYAQFFTTDVRVIVTKFDEHGNENIVYSRTVEADSYGNYNWAYDEDYTGDPGTPPGTTKGWKGSFDSPNIQVYKTYINNRHTLVISTRCWSMSGPSINYWWNNLSIELT